MSVRMDASLYSEVARIEKGDFLRFHCEQLSHLRGDVQRYFFGVYYPRWRAFYLEEVREIIGNLGYTQLRSFPAYPFDVYRRETGEMYLTDDFVVGNVLVIGEPQNQRDDAVKRFRIVSVDDSLLRTKTASASSGLPAILHNFASSTRPRSIKDGAADFTLSMLQVSSTTAGLGAVHVPVELDDAMVELLSSLRQAYIAHEGGGIPEVGLKAMGRPFRTVAEDGRRWMSLHGIEQLVRDSRGFGVAQPAPLAVTQRTRDELRDIAEAIYNAFPHGGDEALVGADTFAASRPVGGAGAEASFHATRAAGPPSVRVLPPTGGVDYDVFMDVIRGHMGPARKKAVWDVFTALDFDGDGMLAIQDMQACFNAQEHPVVVRDNIFSAEGLLKGFLAIWDANNKEHGMVPYAEFLDYYNGLSAIIEDDAVFLSILKTTWKLPSFAGPSSRNRPKFP